MPPRGEFFRRQVVTRLGTQTTCAGKSASESRSLMFMSKRGFTMRGGAGAHIVSVGLVLAGMLSCGASLPEQIQTRPPASPGATALTRACSANPVLPATSGKKKSSHSPKHPLPPEPAPTCVEVKGEAIEIQEFLQNAARDQAWRIGENRASEDTWSYVRYFDAEELDKFADTKVLIEPVEFSGGKAAVTVRTTELGEGYVRVQISVHIQGEGKSTEKTMGQPGSVWPLNSKGVLEQELVTALQTRYRPMQ